MADLTTRQTKRWPKTAKLGGGGAKTEWIKKKEQQHKVVYKSVWKYKGETEGRNTFVFGFAAL
jgi:hypothetical protein